MAPAGVEPAPRRLRVGRSPLSYGANDLHSNEMWPAGIEPAARRVSNGRSTGLSYGHVGWARLDSNQRRLVCWTSTLARLSYSPTCWEELRNKGSNLGLHVQSVASCPLDDPGSQTAGGRALRPPRVTRSTQWHRRWRPCARASCHVRPRPNDVVQATRLPFDPGSPASASYVEGIWSPALLLLREIRRQKQPIIQRRI
jgi:hypothetical protein